MNTNLAMNEELVEAKASIDAAVDRYCDDLAERGLIDVSLDDPAEVAFVAVVRREVARLVAMQAEAVRAGAPALVDAIEEYLEGEVRSILSAQAYEAAVSGTKQVQ